MGGAVAFDNDGKQIKKFGKNTGDVKHQQNFIDAVRAQDRSLLNAEIAVGNDSTGWCNLANVAFQAGKSFSREGAREVKLDQWETLLGEMDKHLAAHDLELSGDEIKLSPMLQLDPETEQFVGEGSDAANELLKRKYRKKYEVPEIA